jgi:hypothetical protein
VADGQTKASATKLGARSRLSKRLKDRAQILGFNPDAGIDDVEAQTAGCTRTNEELHLTLRGEFDGVPEQVEQDLPQMAAVEGDAGG